MRHAHKYLALLGLSALFTTACGRDDDRGRLSVIAAEVDDGLDLPNFHKVNAAFYRSAHLDDAAFAKVASLGIKTVLSLEDYLGDQSAADHEASAAQQAGLKFLWQPMDPLAKPTVTQVNAALASILDPANAPVLIHCQFGKDRTGIVAAAYRMKVEHWSQERAVAELYDYGHSPFLGWWDDLLNEFR